jgi:hypothetical protein
VDTEPVVLIPILSQICVYLTQNWNARHDVAPRNAQHCGFSKSNAQDERLTTFIFDLPEQWYSLVFTLYSSGL